MEGFFAGLVCGITIATLVPSPSALPKEIEWAEKVCVVNGGVAALRPAGRIWQPAKVRCQNSATFVLTP